MTAGKECFRTFTNRHPSSLRQLEAVPMSRTESPNKEDINDFFLKVTLVMNDSGVFDKTNLIYNVEEKGYVLQNLMAEGELVFTAMNCDNNGHLVDYTIKNTAARTVAIWRFGTVYEVRCVIP